MALFPKSILLVLLLRIGYGRAHARSSARASTIPHFSNPSKNRLLSCIATRTVLSDCPLFRIRGGAIASTPATAKNSSKASSAASTRKKTNANNIKDKRQRRNENSIFQLTPVPSHTIRVQAMLSDRVVRIKALGRVILSIFATTFFKQCVHTAGIPRRQAIWTQLQNANIIEDLSMVPPDDYQPTALDTFLATQVAKAANDLLPPSAMPNSRPLLGTILATAAFILLTVLLPHWILSVQVWLDYRRQNLYEASSSSSSYKRQLPGPTAILIQTSSDGAGSSSDTTSSPDVNNKQKRVLCKLHSTSLRAQTEESLPSFYFEHEYRRYYLDPKTLQVFDGGPNLQVSISTLVQQAQSTRHHNKFVGLLNKPSQLMQAQDRWYAYNHQTTVPIPTIFQAVWERLKSPLVVVQLIGKSMAVLEEGKTAFLSFGQTVFQHYHNARRSILASRTLQQDVTGLAEEFAKTPIWIYRNSYWKRMVASDLLPGDLFLLTTPSPTESKVIPVDALVLDGLCVTMEAVLTGESVPQTKMPIDSTTIEWNQTLDMTGTHRNAVLFAGTTLLHCAPPENHAVRHKNGLPKGIVCLALRTGSYSSKGKLIAVLTSSRTQAGAATISNPQFDRDALRLITAMSFVTVLACASLFLKPSSSTMNTLPTKRISGFRRTIQCTRIASACIPSDLPLALSAVVQSCASVLREEADVVCTQPGALLTASQIDTVVLDKTGTITADTQSLSKIVTFSTALKSKTDNGIVQEGAASKETATQSNKQSTEMAKLVLAGCHSLVYVKETQATPSRSTAKAELGRCMIGDPLEQVALQFSGWSYNSTGEFFAPPIKGRRSMADITSVERLWQLKVFPFSPTVRLSSAICLAQHSNGKFKLWIVVKGAPEAVKTLINGTEVNGPKQDIKKVSWFDRKVQKLESKGFRVIAMGARELLPGNLTLVSTGGESHVIKEARKIVANVHRNDVEAQEASVSFAGFACFSATTRPSSKRILREFKNGNVHSIMLTGDGMRSALAVASKVGMLSDSNKIVALEMSAGRLHWRSTTAQSSKVADKLSKLSPKTTKKILQRAERGEVALVASGDAVMALLGKAHIQIYKQILGNLNLFSVIARASPDCKEFVVRTIRDTGRRVLMCGDGVNDVSAMKEAEVSVALLNGFGGEQDLTTAKGNDFEDSRRRQRIKNKRLGMHVKKAPTELEKEGIGSSSAAAAARVQRSIEQAQKRIDKRAAERSGIKLPASKPIPYTLVDAKDMISCVFSAIREERRRATKLKQGGGEAATILAEEDAFLKAQSTNLTLATAEVKPGEACMASPFSCLRSSIDGVEAVLRAGVATAACALSVQQKITLHSLMSCFNLSALYRDGFKYGKNMWTMEFLWYLMVDQASYSESTKMRPHLPRTARPSAQSLFDVSNMLSVVLQAGVHLVTTELGIRFGRTLEAAARLPAQGNANKNKLQIRAVASQSSRIAALLDALAKSKAASLLDSKEDEDDSTASFFGGTKFTPNYETNAVFVLSVLQSSAGSLLLHKGKPFYPSILESRKLCLWAGLSALFVVAATLESAPLLNKWLELRPWSYRRDKFVLLGLAAMDVLVSAMIEWACRQRFRSSLQMEVPQNPSTASAARGKEYLATAADEEESLLEEEARRNFRLLINFAAAAGFLLVDAARK